MADDLVTRLESYKHAVVHDPYGNALAREVVPLCLEAAARIRELEAAMEWRPIEKTRPEHGDRADLWVVDDEDCAWREVACRWNGRWEKYVDGDGWTDVRPPLGRITHYRPLPEPPK